MEPSFSAVLGVFMRWLHILSAVTLVGGFIYARLIIMPALSVLQPAERLSFMEQTVARVRPILYTALVMVLGSGLYNYLTKPFFPPHYHMVIGIKFLFVLHIFAVSILYTIPNANEAVRRRWLSGLAIVGVIILAISADLRWMTLSNMVLR